MLKFYGRIRDSLFGPITDKKIKRKTAKGCYLLSTPTSRSWNRLYIILPVLIWLHLFQSVSDVQVGLDIYACGRNLTSMSSYSESITTTVQTNKRGDVRIPAEVRKALDFDNKKAILQIDIELKKVIDDEDDGGET